MHALIIDGTVTQVGTPPDKAFAEGRWWDLRSLDPVALAAAGWIPAEASLSPAATATVTYDQSWAVVGGKAVQSWTERPKTTAELAADTARASQEVTRTAVKAIVNDLQAEKARCDVVLAKTNAAITGADTKDVARAAKRIADAAIDLARFVSP